MIAAPIMKPGSGFGEIHSIASDAINQSVANMTAKSNLGT